ncbi:MAG: LCP family protein [bacterium]|nr:LCP family protein [bacterium]
MIPIQQKVCKRRRKTSSKINLREMILNLKRLHGTIVFLAVFLLVGIFIYKNSGAVNRMLFLDKRINVLTLCVDKIACGRQIDTISLVSLSPRTNQVHVLFIPMDTMLKVHYKDLTKPMKINHIYLRGGPVLLGSCIEKTLDTKIPFYAILDYSGIKKIVDILGGVRVDVKKGMRYIDKTKGVYINIPKGQQYLCGEKVVQYIRFIPKEDGERVKRQQEIINALTKKVSKQDLFRSKRLVRIIKRYIKTNLSLRDTITLCSLGKKVDGKISIFTIEDQPVYANGIDYWKINLVKAKKLLKELNT